MKRSLNYWTGSAALFGLASLALTATFPGAAVAQEGFSPQLDIGRGQVAPQQKPKTAPKPAHAGGQQLASASQAVTTSSGASASAKPAVSAKPVASAMASADPAAGAEAAKPKKPAAVRAASSVKGPYYVDFRARTAASYGHAFVWFGKTSDKKVDVAGLHPAGDEVPFVLGHLIPVPAETGASYGDLDPQYLTANYRVYMNEADAKRVFAYIRHLQASNKLWNEMTNNCTTFLGQIASFMGLKTPFYLKVPEDYVNSLKELNGGKQFVQLSPDPLPGEN